MVNVVLPVQLANPVNKVLMVTPVQPGHPVPDLPASRVVKATPDQEVFKDHKALKVPRADPTPVFQAVPVLPVLMVNPVLKDHVVTAVVLVHQVHLLTLISIIYQTTT